MVNSATIPSKDTWIAADLSTSNFGTDPIAYIAESYGTKRYGLLQFTLPASLGTITKIDLKIYDAGTYSSTRRVDLYQSGNTTWSETGVTWNSGNPSYTGSIIDYKNSVNGGGWITYNIMGGGAGNPLNSLTWGNTVSFTLVPNGTTAGWQGIGMYTREYTTDTAKRPYLEITYTPVAGGSSILYALI